MRRLRDAVALNVGAAFGFHVLTLACRFAEARRQRGRDGLAIADILAVFSQKEQATDQPAERSAATT